MIHRCTQASKAFHNFSHEAEEFLSVRVLLSAEISQCAEFLFSESGFLSIVEYFHLQSSLVDQRMFCGFPFDKENGSDIFIFYG